MDTADAFSKLSALVAEAEAAGLTKEQIAADMKTSSPLLCQWLGKKQRPGHAFRLKIERWSKGFGADRVIRSDEWLDEDERADLKAVRPFRAPAATPTTKAA
jgi:transcriptional regulator with XRE-family HTH domain